MPGKHPILAVIGIDFDKFTFIVTPPMQLRRFEVFRSQEVGHLSQAFQVAYCPRAEIDLVALFDQPGVQFGDLAQHFLSLEHPSHARDEGRELGRKDRMFA